MILLGVGGAGLGTAFTSILAHVTTVATPRYAADISGVFTSSLQTAGAIGIATYGNVYLALARPQPFSSGQALAIVTAAFTVTLFVASILAFWATVRPRLSGGSELWELQPGSRAGN